MTVYFLRCLDYPKDLFLLAIDQKISDSPLKSSVAKDDALLSKFWSQLSKAEGGQFPP